MQRNVLRRYKSRLSLFIVRTKFLIKTFKCHLLCVDDVVVIVVVAAIVKRFFLLSLFFFIYFPPTYTSNFDLILCMFYTYIPAQNVVSINSRVFFFKLSFFLCKMFVFVCRYTSFMPFSITLAHAPDMFAQCIHCERAHKIALTF